MSEYIVEPQGLAADLVRFLDCPCRVFAPMSDDGPLWEAYLEARVRGKEQGFTPVLIGVDDILWECLTMNVDPEAGSDFDPEAVKQFRERTLAAQLPSGADVLAQLKREMTEDMAENGFQWSQEALGAMEGGTGIHRFISYWNYSTRDTEQMILAEIPTAEPWKIFAWLPMGGWNDCPGELEMMAVTKYWYEKHGAVPGAMSHDELEFHLGEPVSPGEAMKLAEEQYFFCIDRVEQSGEDTVGALADSLSKSKTWYFWWD